MLVRQLNIEPYGEDSSKEHGYELYGEVHTEVCGSRTAFCDGGMTHADNECGILWGGNPCKA